MLDATLNETMALCKLSMVEVPTTDLEGKIGSDWNFGDDACPIPVPDNSYEPYRAMFYRARRAATKQKDPVSYPKKINDTKALDCGRISIDLGSDIFTVVDSDKYDLVKNYTWSVLRRSENLLYAQSSCKILMHRLILGVIGSDRIVDHKDGDGLNNRTSNLRIATYSQNMFNRIKGRGRTSSIYKGVHWSNYHKKWKAQINLDRRRRSLGYFMSEKEAALAYNAAAIDLYGDFAKLNVIGVGCVRIEGGAE